MVAGKVSDHLTSEGTSVSPWSTLDQMGSFLNSRIDSDLRTAVCRVSVEQLLVSRLSPLVSMREKTLKCGNFRELVFAFESDWKSLVRFRTEWMQLLTSLIRIDASITGGFPQDTTMGARMSSDAWVAELMNGLAWPLSIRSVLDASLAPLPTSESRQILSDNVQDVIREMASHMVYQLDVLTERCVLGKIKWFSDNACQYSFIDRSTVSQTTSADLVGRVLKDRKNKVAWIKNQISGVTDKKITVHVHDLVDAVSSCVEDGIASIPVHVQEILQNVPRVLIDDVRMVEGNLIRERCVEKDLGQVTWTVTEDIMIPCHFDPAIVLAGRYVLVGWVDRPSFDMDSGNLFDLNRLKKFWGRIFE